HFHAAHVRTVGPAARPSYRRRSSLNAPFLDPRGHQRACTGKRPHFNSGGDEASLTPGCFSAPPPPTRPLP
ncbi:hypothetical protein M9458_046005, partial [Cirrhinus mrigala]